jgi:hypothetical protein
VNSRITRSVHDQLSSPLPNGTDDIAERLKRDTEARVQESRRLIEAAKRTLTGSLSLVERHG